MSNSNSLLKRLVNLFSSPEPNKKEALEFGNDLVEFWEDYEQNVPVEKQRQIRIKLAQSWGCESDDYEVCSEFIREETRKDIEEIERKKLA